MNELFQRLFAASNNVIESMYTGSDSDTTHALLELEAVLRECKDLMGTSV